MEQIDREIQSLFQRREHLEEKKRQLLKESSDSLSNEEIQDYISSSVVVKNPNPIIGIPISFSKSTIFLENDKKWASSDFTWSKELSKLASDYFNIKSFRPNQREIMNCTLSNKDAFVIMPTGGGISLCYQLPAIYSKGITAIFSLFLFEALLLSFLHCSH
jgi:hypothetical protein